jgi:hypothetical protein
MEMKLLHFLLVMLVAVAADYLLTVLDHKVEAVAESLHEPEAEPERWTHHHPVMGSLDNWWRRRLKTFAAA